MLKQVGRTYIRFIIQIFLWKHYDNYIFLLKYSRQKNMHEHNVSMKNHALSAMYSDQPPMHTLAAATDDDVLAQLVAAVLNILLATLLTAPKLIVPGLIIIS